MLVDCKTIRFLDCKYDLKILQSCDLIVEVLAPIVVESPQRSEDLERIAGLAPNQKSYLGSWLLLLSFLLKFPYLKVCISKK